MTEVLPGSQVYIAQQQSPFLPMSCQVLQIIDFSGPDACKIMLGSEEPKKHWGWGGALHGPESGKAV